MKEETGGCRDPRPAGLDATEAAQRLRRYGYNELPSPDRRSLWRILRELFRQPMFLLLLGGGTVYLLLGDRVEAALLLAFAGLSVSIGVVQELRSEKVLEALRKLASPRARVIRDGQPVQIAGREVVPGDLLLVAEGERIAADAKLIAVQDVLVDESLLTGESVPVTKRAASDTLSADDGNSGLLFAGTLLVRGSGQARVVATGADSEMGKLGHALEGIVTEQPQLQKQLKWLVRDFAIIGALAGATVVLLYALLRGSWLEALLAGIAIGMSLLPEEFPLVLAVFMAMGAWRISRARVLTRRATAIETLGATTVLCTDKTGTLTENRMSVAGVQSEHDSWQSLAAATAMSAAQASVLHTALRACPQLPSDPMDIAIHAQMQRLDPAGTERFMAQRILRAYGLRPDLFAVANVLDDEGSPGASAKGALEAIAGLCALPEERLTAIRAQADARAREGVRVLAVARARLAKAQPPPESLAELSFEYVGLIGFADPLRGNVPAAVAECRSAGIRVVMITGDYPETAVAIAAQAGIDTAQVLSGAQMEAMSDAQLARSVRGTSVFARIRPTQKLRIVQSLKANGEVVAMTGDGVNDAPAIKAAHIGIAMGGRGTDVAREASDIVLLDDDFGSIVKTIRLGRRIYDNLRKAIEYIVAVHIPIAGLAILPMLLGLPLIFTPILIAFLEMVIDPACSVVFEAESDEADVMQRPPRDPAAPLLLPRRIAWAVVQGVVALAIVAGTLLIAAQARMPEDELRALVFSALVLVNMGLILVNRSFSASLLDALRQPNPWLWWLLGSVSALLAIALCWPPAMALFHFGPLHLDDLSICALAGALSLFGLEALKRRWFAVS
ncbi:Ca2+-transporting ATPase [Solimonas aquatica]|uniref:Ca2+-transporting ATPase n=1 Tax=Solimonas aquatica TaxID=489703 RepID=A0A1H9ACY4_9GAMM|nr:cation-translocating P-type ATPase [Solimonas aquatica]SEP74596.1 Ca2+-transporting ATPase [Solimonas aquatica]